MRAIWHTYRKTLSPFLPEFDDENLVQLLSPSCIAANFDVNEGLTSAGTLRDVTDKDVSIIMGRGNSMLQVLWSCVWFRGHPTDFEQDV